ncbi:MAG: hypothetical protein SFX73_06265 [Kofleriaceae bacterium]|nr:hypothetical protein [Kofleriaceae bacterium]
MVLAPENARRAEVMRVFERYLVEIVEAYDLCPWARSARLHGEVAAEVVWGTPSLEEWVATAQALLVRPETRVAMVIAPELSVTPSDLRGIRAEVTRRIPSAGIADFHPAAELDLTTPARLVPFVRRTPDPLIQLVPLALLESVRVVAPQPSLAEQAQMLDGTAPPPKLDVGDRIAAANHATVSAVRADILAKLADIAADRDASYARAGIANTSPRP